MIEMATNVLVRGVQVGQQIFRAPGLAVHAGEDDEGVPVAVIVLQAVATQEQVKAFRNIAHCAELSGLEIRSAEEHVILATPQPQGTIEQLPLEHWRLPQRLEYFSLILEHAQRYHARGVAVGTLTPHYVLIDDNFNPFLLGPEIAPRSGPFVAPETANRRQVDQLSDIFTLGKLLYYFVAQKDPPREARDKSRLEEIAQYPAGLVRIIRKATHLEREERYRTIDDLITDLQLYGRHSLVGICHSDVEELNLGGLSLDPAPPQTNLKPEPKKEKEKETSAKTVVMMPQERIYERRTRMWRSIGVAIALLGAALFATQGPEVSPDLMELDKSELRGLPPDVLSVSLGQSEPRAFFAKVDTSWDDLSMADRNTLARQIVAMSQDRWGPSDGFVMRGEATVAQYWNGELVVMGEPRKRGLQ